MRRRFRRNVGAVVGSIAAAIPGCSDDGVMPLDPDGDGKADPPVVGLVVSEPLSGTGAASAVRLAGWTATGTAYVSAVPGTFPGAVSIEIRNLTTGEAPTGLIPVVGGGFDPVPVPASPDDELQLALDVSNGGTSYLTVFVPERRPPTVVRTSPRQGRTDVALSVRILVVLSEPIDPASVSPTSVWLFDDGVPVEATVGLQPDSPFTVELVPGSPLEPSTAYELVVTPEIQDLDQDALEEPFTTRFTTESGSQLVTVQVTRGWDPITFEYNPYYSYRWFTGPDAYSGDCAMNACPAQRLTVTRISEPTTVVLEFVDVSGNGFEGVFGGSVPPGAVVTVEDQWVGPTTESILYQVSVTLLDGTLGSGGFDSSYWCELYPGLAPCTP